MERGDWTGPLMPICGRARSEREPRVSVTSRSAIPFSGSKGLAKPVQPQHDLAAYVPDFPFDPAAHLTGFSGPMGLRIVCLPSVDSGFIRSGLELDHITKDAIGARFLGRMLQDQMPGQR